MDTLIVGIQAADNFAPTLEKFKRGIVDVSKSIDASKKSTEDLTGAFGNMLGKIPGVSDATGVFGNALKLMKNPMVEGIAVIGTLVTSMIGFAQVNMQNVLELNKLSHSTGLTINTLQGLKRIAADSDVPFEVLTNSFIKLEKNLGKNSEGFKKLGIDTHDPLQATAQLADKFSSLHDPVERARVGVMAYGKTWADMAPILDAGGAAILKAKESSTISDGMVERYKKMHESQLDINRGVGSWTKLLGDIGSVFLDPILEKLATMASSAKKLADDLRRALGMTANKDELDKILHEAGTAGAAAANPDLKQGDKRLLGGNFGSISNVGAGDVAGENSILNSLSKKNSEDQKIYIDMLKTMDQSDLEMRHITKSAIDKLVAQQQQTAKDEKKRIDPDKKEKNKLAEYEGQSFGKDDLHSDSSYGYRGYDDQLKRADKEKLEAIKLQYDELKKLQEEATKLNISYSMFDDNSILAKKIVEKQKADEQLKKSNADQKKTLEDLSKTISGTLTPGFEGFFQNIRKGNQSLASNFVALGKTIKDSMVNAAIKGSAEYLANKVATFAAEKVMILGQMAWAAMTGESARVAETAQVVTQAGIQTGALAAPAAMQSTISFGAAAGIGVAALLAGIVMAKSFDVGTPYVDRNQLARIHQGEIILPRSQSDAFRSGNMGPASSFILGNNQNNQGNPIYNVTINGSNLSSDDIKSIVISSFKTLQKQNSWNKSA